ncbi:hypothetical protein [Runella sp.]|uniref:hypothetical protein n=1 Tax=Runella sp. TaxID=1960881 RepID=UPI003D0E020D
MKTLAQTLGVFVGLMIVGVCVAIGFYDRREKKSYDSKNWWDSHDNGAHIQ